LKYLDSAQQVQAHYNGVAAPDEDARATEVAQIAESDMVVEIPAMSNNFYVLECPACGGAFADLEEMVTHENITNHVSTTGSPASIIQLVNACGTLVVDATSEWLEDQQSKAGRSGSASTVSIGGNDLGDTITVDMKV
jgi:hypothetical protein